MPSARSTNAGSNPNAQAIYNTPEVLSSGRRVAPAPPGTSYWMNRCGVTGKDGERCIRLKMKGHETCLGHSPKVKNDES